MPQRRARSPRSPQKASQQSLPFSVTESSSTFLRPTHSATVMDRTRGPPPPLPLERPAVVGATSTMDSVLMMTVSDETIIDMDKSDHGPTTTTTTSHQNNKDHNRNPNQKDAAAPHVPLRAEEEEEVHHHDPVVSSSRRHRHHRAGSTYSVRTPYEKALELCRAELTKAASSPSLEAKAALARRILLEKRRSVMEAYTYHLPTAATPTETPVIATDATAGGPLTAATRNRRTKSPPKKDDVPLRRPRVASCPPRSSCHRPASDTHQTSSISSSRIMTVMNESKTSIASTGSASVLPPPRRAQSARRPFPLASTVTVKGLSKGNVSPMRGSRGMASLPQDPDWKQLHQTSTELESVFHHERWENCKLLAQMNADDEVVRDVATATPPAVRVPRRATRTMTTSQPASFVESSSFAPHLSDGIGGHHQEVVDFFQRLQRLKQKVPRFATTTTTTTSSRTTDASFSYHPQPQPHCLREVSVNHQLPSQRPCSNHQQLHSAPFPPSSSSSLPIKTLLVL